MKTIKGIIPPMITPLKGDDQIDREGTVRLTEHILAGGVHALFLLGTDVHDSNSRILNSYYMFHINRTHARELDQMG